MMAGCAGRAPNLVAVVQATDKELGCDQITFEVQSNNDRISELAKEQGLKATQNVVAGVAGFVVPVLWLGMDWQGTAAKEAKALSQRNQYLAGLAQKRC